MSESATLVKFGSETHLLQLLESGLLYMKNLPYFWRVEDDGLRGDPCDSIHRLERGSNGTGILRIANNTAVPIHLESWTFRIHPSEPEKMNIFCMYALRPLAGSFPIDERNYRFDDHALLLTEPQQFIDRIHRVLTEKHIQHTAGLVEYFGDDYTGEIGPFKKQRAFSYQSEWRLVCFNGPGTSLNIEIGSIQDIAVIVRSGDINDVVKIDDSARLTIQTPLMDQ
jgi:hypothetical protein